MRTKPIYLRHNTIDFICEGVQCLAKMGNNGYNGLRSVLCNALFDSIVNAMAPLHCNSIAKNSSSVEPFQVVINYFV